MSNGNRRSRGSDGTRPAESGAPGQPPLPGIGDAVEDGDVSDPFFESLGPRFRTFVDSLDRPLVFFDTETTGTDPQQDRIVEISIVRLLPGVHRIDGPYTFRVDPQRPIPEAATQVHGISNEDVRGCPTFAAIAPRIVELIEGADFAGFNVLRFDLRLLEAEFARANVDVDLRSRRVVDAQVIFHSKEPRTLSAAVRFYRGKELEGAHGAEADTLATVEVLAGQLERYEDLPVDADALHALSTKHERAYVDSGRKFVWKDDEPAFNFGKLKGMSLRDAAANPEHQGYLKWMLTGSFDPDTKRVVRQALAGDVPRRKPTGESTTDNRADDNTTGNA
ncbi:MAG: 3'-5' exonuclease [Deltaproteobacteria bacterium]|nr:MAG: 3'-5' exonuclease [Deltaproteobacteria bacterium]